MRVGLGVLALLAVLATAGDAGSGPSLPPATTAGPSTTRQVPITVVPPSPVTAPVTPSPTSAPTSAPTPHEACLLRAVFGDPGDSPYRLPFPPEAGYTVLQSYCVDEGSHETQLAYDFFMPRGSTVVAARAGVVREVVENVADDAHTSRLNYLLIQHEDGTVAFYAHLQQDGALVGVGDQVAAGEPIAVGGASGRTHGSGVLHFGVYRAYPPREERDLAVNFSNAEGMLDARGGLRTGAFYRALP